MTKQQLISFVIDKSLFVRQSVFDFTSLVEFHFACNKKEYTPDDDDANKFFQ